MNILGIFSLVIGSLTILYFIKKHEKAAKNDKKPWVILEHEEGQLNNTNKCYRAENKFDSKKSPCFNRQEDLLNWIQQQNKMGVTQFA